MSKRKKTAGRNTRFPGKTDRISASTTPEVKRQATANAADDGVTVSDYVETLVRLDTQRRARLRASA